MMRTTSFCLLAFLVLIFDTCIATKASHQIAEESYQDWLIYVDSTSDLGDKKMIFHTGKNDDLNPKLLKAEQNKRKITVAQDGSGHYMTIGEAVNAVPERNRRRTVIYIKSGTYREKVHLPATKPFITLFGEDPNRVIISGNATASNVFNSTFNSSTVSVESRYFIARNLIFENTAPPPAPGEIGKQAVAFRISADMAAFYNCKFYGAQDTLYDHIGRHYFKNCFIQGSIDFIFGNGRSLYSDCEIKSLPISEGSVTAQQRNEEIFNSGFSFVNCIITGSGTVYLGRAWGDYSRVVYAYTYMDTVVLPEGWHDWGDPERERTVFYGQYKCSGPGASLNKRVGWARQLNDQEAKPFLDIGFIHGSSWLQRRY